MIGTAIIIGVMGLLTIALFIVSLKWFTKNEGLASAGMAVGVVMAFVVLVSSVVSFANWDNYSDAKATASVLNKLHGTAYTAEEVQRARDLIPELKE